MPHVQQRSGCQECASACIKMWRLYDGLSNYSLDFIAAAIGANCFTGASESEIVYGVNTFTNTFDAFRDFGDRITQEPYYSIDDFIAREVESIDSHVPFIAIWGSLHAVVARGGYWHESDGQGVWDTVFFNDPFVSFGSQSLGADQWLNKLCVIGFACQQIISQSAVAGWPGDLGTYGSSVGIAGVPPHILNKGQ